MNSYHNKSYRSRDTCQSYSRRSRCTFAWHNHHTEESVCNLHNTTSDISHNYPASCLHSHSHNFDINASSILSKCVDRFQTDFLHLESMAFPHHAPTDGPVLNSIRSRSVHLDLGVEPTSDCISRWIVGSQTQTRRGYATYVERNSICFSAHLPCE